MKTKSPFILCLAAILCYSCSQLDFDAEPMTAENGNKSTLSTSDAKFNVSMSAVETFLYILNKDKEEDDKKEVSRILPVIYNGDTLMYIVNYKDDKGWLLVSGDKRTESILACDDKGDFDLGRLNPGVGIWTEDLTGRIYALKQRETIASDTLSENYTAWSRIEEYASYLAGESPQTRQFAPVESEAYGYWELYNITVQTLPTVQKGPLIQTKWGQESPWNECIPYTTDLVTRCPTGCVAVAGAQMLYYLHYNLGVPATTYSTGYCTGWSYDEDSYNYSFGFGNANASTWDLMDKRATYYYTKVNGKDVWMPYYNDGTNRVAVLMGHVGSSIGMKYSKEGSSATTSDLVYLFSDKGIRSSYSNYNSATVLNSLNNDMPVILRAYSEKDETKILGIVIHTSYKEGHTWIADGYEQTQTKYTSYYRWVEWEGGGVMPNPRAALPPLVNEERIEESIVSSYLLIMNWGADGSYDSGRYSLNQDDWVADGRNYRFEKKMISGFAKK